MAASVANSRKALTSGTSTTTTTSFTSTAGNTIWLSVSDQSGTGALTVGDNKGNVYGQIGTTQTGGTSGAQLRRYYCANIAGGAGHTVTVTWPGASDAVVCVLELAGVTTTPLDQSAQAQDSASPWTVTSPTLTQADEIAVTAVSGAWGGTWSESSGFTINQSEGNDALYWTSAAGSKVVSATTALTPSWSITGGGTWSAVSIDTFKASAAASGYSGTPGQGALTLSGPAATVVRTANVSFSPAQTALTVSGSAPTVVQSSGLTLTPGAQAITLTGLAPTLAQTANRSLVGGGGSLVVAGYAPTVTVASASVSLVPGADALAITGYAPDLVQSGAAAGNYEREKRRRKVERAILDAERAEEKQAAVEAATQIVEEYDDDEDVLMLLL
jgi:hypothetical protein